MSHVFELGIGYTLPKGENIYDARNLESTAIRRRTVAIQSCANGDNPPLCEKEVEKSFRIDISSIPGINFYISFFNRGVEYKLFNLMPDEAIDDNLDQVFDHIPPRKGVPLGIIVDLNVCKLKTKYNQKSINYSSEFIKMICILINSYMSCDSKWTNNPLTNPEIIKNHKININFFIDRAYDINSSDNLRLTPLAIASAYNRLDIVSILLDMGADVNVKDINGDTPLIFSSICGNKDIVKILLDNYADINSINHSGDTALILASITGRTEVVILLLENGADINIDHEGMNAISMAAYNGHANIVKILLENGADINTDHEGMNAISATLFEDHGDVIKVILEYNDLINYYHDYLVYIQSSAIQGGKSNVLKALIEKDFYVNLNLKDNEGMTPLMHALSDYNQKNAEIAKLLLNQANIFDINVKDNNGRTALFYALKLFCKVEENRREIITNFYRQHDFKNEHRTIEEFKDPKHDLYVIETDLFNLISLFQESGASLKDDNYLLMLLNLLNDGSYVSDVKFLLIKLFIIGGANVNIQDNSGNTVLHHLIHSASIDTLKFLLEHDANVNIQNDFGDTALHSFFNGYRYDKYDVLKLLLEHNANVNIQNKYGQTALISMVDKSHYWDESLQIKCIGLLFENGLDPNLKDNDGNTALMYTMKNKSLKLSKMLIEKGAKVPKPWSFIKIGKK